MYELGAILHASDLQIMIWLHALQVGSASVGLLPALASRIGPAAATTMPVTVGRTSPLAGNSRFDSRGCPVHRNPRPRAEVVPLRPGCCSSPESSGFQGPRTRSGTRDMIWCQRPEGDQWYLGSLPEALPSTPHPLRHPQPCVPCGRRLSAQLKASPVEKDAGGTIFASWRRSSARLLDRRTRWSR